MELVMSEAAARVRDMLERIADAADVGADVQVHEDEECISVVR